MIVTDIISVTIYLAAFNDPDNSREKLLSKKAGFHMKDRTAYSLKLPHTFAPE